MVDMIAGRLSREILAGSISAATTASLFSPLELVKTRLQVQSDPTAQVSRIYRHGFVDALCVTARTDGVRALWTHGFLGFVLRDFFYSGIRIGAYPSVRMLYAGKSVEKDEIGLSSKILAGATTGGVGSAIANPFDVVRVRMSVEGGLLCGRTGLLSTGMKTGQKPLYTSSLHCFRLTYANEGIRGLYKGVLATSMRAAMLSAGQLASYDHSKTLIRKYGILEEGNSLHMVCAVISGIVACLCCHPADCLKARLMVLRATNLNSMNILTVARDIYVSDGLKGFFRGFWPAYARAGPSFFIQMPIVEGLRDFFGVGAL